MKRTDAILLHQYRTRLVWATACQCRRSVSKGCVHAPYATCATSVANKSRTIPAKKSLHHFQGPCRGDLLGRPLSDKECLDFRNEMDRCNTSSPVPDLPCTGHRLSVSMVSVDGLCPRALRDFCGEYPPPPTPYTYCMYTVTQKGGKMRASSQPLRTHCPSLNANLGNRNCAYPCLSPTGV